MAVFRGKVDTISVSNISGKVICSDLIDVATGDTPDEGPDAMFVLWLDIGPPDPVASQTLLNRSLWVSFCEKALENPPERGSGLEVIINTLSDTSANIVQLRLVAAGAAGP